jgi:hypothetical protein
MADNYRYLFADLLTNNILAELPLTGVQFTQQLNQAGTFQGHILLSGINAAAFNVSNATIPGRTALYVDADGTLIWGGIIWGREYNSNAQSLGLTAREFESYFEKRVITSDQVFTSVDQLTIAQTLFNNAQAATNGNIGVVVPSNTSGVLVSRTYYGYELKQVYSAVQDLSKALNGFDFNIQVSYVGGIPTKTLQMGYPRIGTVYDTNSATALVFELPAANIIEYTYPEDGSLVANTIRAIGAGSNEGKLIATAQDATKISAGWPVLEDQVNYTDINDSTLLTQLATGQVNAVSYPPVTMTVIVPADVTPLFTSYKIGDDARVIITDERFPSTLDQIWRIVGLNVTPGEDGPERVTITFAQTTN